MGRLKKSFDHFMWMKTIGKRVIIKDDIAYQSSESCINVHRNLKILDEYGVKYPDWKTAKMVLEENDQ